jgi:hypothetical protein
MPDSKISALAAAQSPLDPAQLFVLTQSGTPDVNLSFAQLMLEIFAPTQTNGGQDYNFAGGYINFSSGGSANFAGGSTFFDDSGNAYFGNGTVFVGRDGMSRPTIYDADALIWAINGDGSATFSNGNLSLNADGSLTVGGGACFFGIDGSAVFASAEILGDGSANFANYGIVFNADGSAYFLNDAIGFDGNNNRFFQKTPNGTKVYLHLTDPVAGVSTATWTTTP